LGITLLVSLFWTNFKERCRCVGYMNDTVDFDDEIFCHPTLEENFDLVAQMILFQLLE